MLQVITHCTDPNLLCSVYLLFLDVCSDLRDGKTPIWGREWDDLMQSLFSRLSQIAILDPLDQLPKIIRKICAGFSWMLHGDVEAIPHRLGGDRGSAACFLDFASVIFVIVESSRGTSKSETSCSRQSRLRRGLCDTFMFQCLKYYRYQFWKIFPDVTHPNTV